MVYSKRRSSSAYVSSETRSAVKRKLLSLSESKYIEKSIVLSGAGVEIANIITNLTNDASKQGVIGDKIHVSAVRLEVTYDNTLESVGGSAPHYVTCFLFDNRQVGLNDIDPLRTFYKGYKNYPYAPHPYIDYPSGSVPSGDIASIFIHTHPLFLRNRKILWRDSIRLHSNTHSDLSGPRYQQRVFTIPVGITYDADDVTAIGRNLTLVIMASNPTQYTESSNGRVIVKATIYIKDV